MSGVLRSIQVSTLVLRGEQNNVCRSATKLLSQTIPGPRAAGAAYEERELTPNSLSCSRSQIMWLVLSACNSWWMCKGSNLGPGDQDQLLVAISTCMDG